MGRYNRRLKRRGDPVVALVGEARGNGIETESCAALEACTVTTVTEGWSIVLSVLKHKCTECWHVSMMLHPPGRPSRKEDWSTLGRILARVTCATGWRSDYGPEPITPFESTHPNLALHWQWHSDGTPVDERVLAAMRDYFRKREAAQPSDGTWNKRG